MATNCAKIERIGRLETGFQQFPLVRFVRGLGGGGGRGERGYQYPISLEVNRRIAHIHLNEQANIPISDFLSIPYPLK